MGRLCTRKPSAMPASRSTASSWAMQRGSPLRLPLVATRGRPSACASNWWRPEAGSITPRAGLPGATASQAPGSAVPSLAARSSAGKRRRNSTIGAAGWRRARSSAAEQCTTASSWRGWATRRAKGLLGRCLRRRRRATASLWLASTSSWNPPTPCRARISPSRSRSQAAWRARSPSARGRPAASRKRRRGPQAGQLIVSAWKRRSAGSLNSAAQAGQGGKAAKVVWARRKGRAVARLKRGPQAQQLMKG